jgi:hypothetical protein
MALNNVDNTNELQKEWDLPVPSGEGSEIEGVFQVLATENQRIDVVLDELYDDRFLQTATNDELEMLGSYVGVDRKTDEEDNKLRKRIAAEFGAKSSNTTFDTFAKIAITILEADKDDILIETPPLTPPKTVNVGISGQVLDENPFETAELVSLLERAIGAGASITIEELGNFGFAGDDTTLEGFGDGTWSSSDFDY